ncbi:MAG: sugar phosphate isomerase/epimerase family protein [Planctomycetaceae bacterium]
MDRRTFLHASSATALTALLARPLHAMPQNSKYLDTIGLQLWTVRNQMEKDEAGTLKAVADAGYKQVELMRTLGSERIVKTAKDNGMKVTSAFIEWTSIGKPDDKNAPGFDKILEAAKKLGLKHLVFGYIGKGARETVDHYKRHAENANKAGEKCAKAGIQLCYHNHSFEFKKLDGGKTGWETFVAEFDKRLVKFEVDVFWVKIGGLDPFKTLESLKGRVSQVHLKDLIKDAKTQHDEGKVPHEAFKELGAGTIDMAKVMKLAARIGAQQCHVEQDQSAAPLTSIQTSMRHLKTL